MILPNILGKEFDCINKIIKKLPNLGIGDDCAVVKLQKSNFLISVDTFIEDVHFDLKYFSLSEVGEKCAEAALSDIAAMGGEALYMLISISVPNCKLIEKISRGFSNSISRHKVKLIGGDITFSKNIVISAVVIGESLKPVYRSGARVNDLIYLTSYTGLSAAGLYVLQNKISGFNFLKKAHKKPRAKLQQANVISKISNALIDISDGLVSELYHLAFSSHVSIVIENLPIHREIKRLAVKQDIEAKDFALFGGEDFELLYTVPKRFSQKAVGHRIGRVIENKDRRKNKVYLEKEGKIILLKSKEFKHFL